MGALSLLESVSGCVIDDFSTMRNFSAGINFAISGPIRLASFK
ncbi:hypothetical protein EV14_1289 [Prochlorococcus sp. MIT 0703]|nr:hypothetical protein EV14_1289 [Prochlorococcus sp. MIT 0703]